MRQWLLGVGFVLGLACSVAVADENKAFQCHRSCNVKNLDCSKRDPRTNRCRIVQQDCLGSCEATPATADAPAQSPVAPLRSAKSDPPDACRQRCGLSRSTCEEGGNDPAMCESGRNACVARCDETYGAAR